MWWEQGWWERTVHITSANVVEKTSASRSQDWPRILVLCHCTSWQFPEPGLCAWVQTLTLINMWPWEKCLPSICTRGICYLLTSPYLPCEHSVSTGVTSWEHAKLFVLTLWGHLWATETLEQSVWDIDMTNSGKAKASVAATLKPFPLALQTFSAWL